MELIQIIIILLLQISANPLNHLQGTETAKAINSCVVQLQTATNGGSINTTDIFLKKDGTYVRDANGKKVLNQFYVKPTK